MGIEQAELKKKSRVHELISNRSFDLVAFIITCGRWTIKFYVHYRIQ